MLDPDHCVLQPRPQVLDCSFSLLFGCRSSHVPSTPPCHSFLRNVSRLPKEWRVILKCPGTSSSSRFAFVDKLTCCAAG
jgi:hypothetical protein